MNNYLRYSIISAFISAALLLFAEFKTDSNLLLFSRFFGVYGAFVQILIVAAYAAYITPKLLNKKTFLKTKKLIWTLFSIVFFSQLFLGIFINNIFLMTGKLHLPIPMMILAGPIYRFEIGFMPILFFTTIIIAGPAWCSNLCYFGAIDYNFSMPGKFSNSVRFSNVLRFKLLVLFVVVLTASLLRFFGASYVISLSFALTYALIGLILIFLFSKKTSKMIHCTMFCPIHSLVSFLKYLNPFRLKIDKNSCTLCMKCVKICKYSALESSNMEKSKPNVFCTYCCDCIVVCDSNSIKYEFFGINKKEFRTAWIIIIVIIHSVFMALARI